MTLQFRPSDKALIKHSTATNPNQVGKLMRECCCAAGTYVEFTSCGTHIADKYVNFTGNPCSLGDRAYHESLCKNADDFGDVCCQVGIGDCSGFSGDDKQSPAEAYENNCAGATEQQIGGTHIVDGVPQTKKRMCRSVYMRLEDFKQMEIGSGGPTMAQLGWLPPGAGGTEWPLAFKIGGHCFVGSPDLRSEAQIKETTDSGGTVIPACKKIDRSSFNEDCAGDKMIYSTGGLAISAGSLNFSTDTNQTMENLCANCCQAVWLNTQDCQGCFNLQDGTTCSSGLEDFAQLLSSEKAAGFAWCDCVNLGTATPGPTQQDFRGKVVGFGGGTSNVNCKQSQCQSVGSGNGSIVDPANARVGGCGAMFSPSGTGTCDPGYPNGVFTHAFFQDGDHAGNTINCEQNCDPSLGGGVNPGPFETCEACLCETPKCACACVQCQPPGSDEDSCPPNACQAQYNIVDVALTATDTTGTQLDGPLSLTEDAIQVGAITDPSASDCKATRYGACCQGDQTTTPPQANFPCIGCRPGGECIDENGDQVLISEGGDVTISWTTDTVKLIIASANILCSPAFDDSCPATATGNNWGIVIEFSLCFGDQQCSSTSQGGTGVTALYRHNAAAGGQEDNTCPDGTYVLCSDSTPDTGFPEFGTPLSLSFPSTVTVQ